MKAAFNLTLRFWPIVALTVVMLASYLLWDNLRELSQ